MSVANSFVCSGIHTNAQTSSLVTYYLSEVLLAAGRLDQREFHVYSSRGGHHILLYTLFHKIEYQGLLFEKLDGLNVICFYTLDGVLILVGAV